ncbi:MAG: organomercurial lyase [Terriglobales bacterium]
MTDSFDTRVRLALYREFVRTSEPPTIKSIAETMPAPADDVRAALERLAAAKAIVLQPESREILMANPLCAVPTPYRVRIQDRSYFGSCVWDALGIIAMLQSDAVLDTSCACCGEAMTIGVHRGHAAPIDGIIHFAIPAKRWWENIVFT